MHYKCVFLTSKSKDSLISYKNKVYKSAKGKLTQIRPWPRHRGYSKGIPFLVTALYV